ncbi:MAG: DUF2784 family protein [Planctomycetaceae bacterium]|nr:DUF2784 family protein [Planctomycetaceae bacterium]
MLSLLNLLFFAVHTALIAFNLVGWIWQSTRRLHLVTLLGTLFSWLVMGYWYGWGYCVCADWHFQVRRRLGIHQDETSYTELLFNQIPGVHVSRTLADVLTVAGLGLILVATGIVWTVDRFRRRFRRESLVTTESGAFRDRE